MMILKVEPVDQWHCLGICEICDPPVSDMQKVGSSKLGFKNSSKKFWCTC